MSGFEPLTSEQIEEMRTCYVDLNLSIHAHDFNRLCDMALIALVDRAQRPEEKTIKDLLAEFLDNSGIAYYDSSCCWGCGEMKTGPCDPDCMLERTRVALGRSSSGPSLPSLICPRCGADRYKEPCKEPAACPMVGDASGPK